MIEYVIRVQVVEKARREGIAEIEQVREIPEQVILSIDSITSWLNLGKTISNAQKVVSFVNNSR